MGGSGGRSVERKLGGAEAEVILLATSWVKPPHANTSAPVQDHLAAVRIGGCGPESVGCCTAAQR